jgi:hypothetical protein
MTWYFGGSITAWSLGLLLAGATLLFFGLRASAINPKFAMTPRLAIVVLCGVFFLSSPLVWYQYYILLLLPILLSVFGAPRPPSGILEVFMIFLLFVLSGGFLTELFSYCGATQPRRIGVMSSVVPLFFVGLLYARRLLPAEIGRKKAADPKIDSLGVSV